ncbi:YbaB/EbfC family nucleoid-associated protein [Saccharopolyspora hordei]|uniref:DNA-binding protein YbaB n=1 Tax=Saccharopolyspora hordei TaxID=1838 RepID=A0A853AEA6_9PSEU|nr:YbaB/EbfC family nucleoid-associated protein [Saccharopolyspora hordei]NYI82824.1 DNA-binding protein YbaB [Saccharopolyspora hordei]
MTHADPDAMIAGFRQQIAAKLQQAERLTQAASGVQGRASSPDGSVTVVVDHSGNMVDLDLTEAALRKRPAEVSQLVLATARAAQAQLAATMQEVMAPIIGDDQETFSAVLSGLRERFPEEPEAPAAPATDPDDDDDTWLQNQRRRWN